MTLNQQAKLFWSNKPPWERIKLIPGLHLLCYGANYDELDSNERQKVIDFITSRNRTAGGLQNG